MKLLVTLDTNELDPPSLALIREALGSLPHELAIVSVTVRERGGELAQLVELQPVTESMVWGESPWGEALWSGPIEPIPESFVVGESRLDEGQLVGENEPDLDEILKITSDGSFPKLADWENLPKGHRNHLRDAMILQAHSRERRHVLVSEDKAFGPKNRDRLETLCRTHLRNRAELVALAQEGRLAELLPT